MLDCCHRHIGWSIAFCWASFEPCWTQLLFHILDLAQSPNMSEFSETRRHNPHSLSSNTSMQIRLASSFKFLKTCSSPLCQELLRWSVLRTGTDLFRPVDSGQRCPENFITILSDFGTFLGLSTSSRDKEKQNKTRAVRSTGSFHVFGVQARWFFWSLQLLDNEQLPSRRI